MSHQILFAGVSECPDAAYICPRCGARASTVQRVPRPFGAGNHLRDICCNNAFDMMILFSCAACLCVWEWEKDREEASTQDASAVEDQA